MSRPAPAPTSRLRRFCLLIVATAVLSLPALPKPASAQEAAVLRFILNEEDLGDAFVLLADDDVWLTRELLSRARLRTNVGTEQIVDGVPHVSLRSIAGLRYTVDAASATLRASAGATLFEAQRIDATVSRQRDVLVPSNNSGFANYAVSYSPSDDVLLVDTELGLRAGPVFATTTFNYERHSDSDRFHRLLSTLVMDDREKMLTFRVGDLFAASGPLGTNVPMGGVSLTRNFETRPYFIRFPSLTLAGAIQTPSEVEVRIDGNLLSRENLSPGEFVVSNVPPRIGPGDASIVIRDAFGTTREIEQPFYFSDRLLKRGLHEYSYAVGFLREDLGRCDFCYPEPAFLAFHNYGFSTMLKAGYSMELSDRVWNAGLNASLLPGRAGVFEIAVNGSYANDRFGGGAQAGYFYQSRPFSTALNLSYISPEYRNVSLDPTLERPSVIRTSVGLSRRQLGSLSAEFIRTSGGTLPESRQYILSYNRNLSNRANFFTILSHTDTEGADDDNRITLNLHVSLTPTVSTTLGYDHSRLSGEEKRVSLQRYLPEGTGLGFRAEARQRRDDTDLFGNAEYQNAYGIFRADYSRVAGDEYNAFAAAGGIGYIGGSFFLSRPITDAFVKVHTGDVENVAVAYYGNESGRTNRHGDFVIPNVRSFQDNRISIDPSDIPVSYRLAQATRYVSPPYRSGAVLDFGVSRVQGFIGTIARSDGTVERPIEFAVLRIRVEDGETVEGLVGRRGEFYFENVPPGRHPAELHAQWQVIPFELDIPDSKEVIVDLGRIVIGAPAGPGRSTSPRPAPPPPPAPGPPRKTEAPAAPAGPRVVEAATAPPDCAGLPASSYVGWTEGLCYDSGTDRLTGDSRALLDRFLRVLGYNRLPIADLWTASDSRTWNRELAGRRLEAARRYLEAGGLAGDRLRRRLPASECAAQLPFPATDCPRGEAGAAVRLVFPAGVGKGP